MEKLKQIITSIDIDNLLAIFDIQIAIGVLIFFILFRTAFSKLVIKIWYKISKSTKNPKESSMYKPLSIFFILLGIYCTINILPTSKQILAIMNNIFRIVVIYYIIKAISASLNEDSIIFAKLFKNSTNKAVDKFLCKVIRVILWILFACIALNECGVDLSGFGGLITGLGIASAATALAAQDLVKSLISGVTILTDKPFVIGDWVEIGQYQGTVIDITFRSIRIKSYNNAVITIPNSTVTAEYVINWNRLTSRRFDCLLGMSLDTTSEKTEKIIKEMRVTLQNNPNVINETVQVYLDDISKGSINIKIYLYINKANYVDFLKVKQEILCSLLFLMEKENIDLVAYPTQTVYLNRKEANNE